MGCSGLPSSFTARPSRVRTCKPHPVEHSVQLLAYQVETPGTWSSACTRYGTSFSTLDVEQPDRAMAPPPDTPSTVRNFRRSMVDCGPSSAMVCSCVVILSAAKDDRAVRGQ